MRSGTTERGDPVYIPVNGHAPTDGWIWHAQPLMGALPDGKVVMPLAGAIATIVRMQRH